MFLLSHVLTPFSLQHLKKSKQTEEDMLYGTAVRTPTKRRLLGTPTSNKSRKVAKQFKFFSFIITSSSSCVGTNPLPSVSLSLSLISLTRLPAFLAARLTAPCALPLVELSVARLCPARRSQQTRSVSGLKKKLNCLLNNECSVSAGQRGSSFLPPFISLSIYL